MSSSLNTRWMSLRAFHLRSKTRMLAWKRLRNWICRLTLPLTHFNKNLMNRCIQMIFPWWSKMRRNWSVSLIRPFRLKCPQSMMTSFCQMRNFHLITRCIGDVLSRLWNSLFNSSWMILTQTTLFRVNSETHGSWQLSLLLLKIQPLLNVSSLLRIITLQAFTKSVSA